MWTGNVQGFTGVEDIYQNKAVQKMLKKRCVLM